VPKPASIAGGAGARPDHIQRAAFCPTWSCHQPQAARKKKPRQESRGYKVYRDQNICQSDAGNAGTTQGAATPDPAWGTMRTPAPTCRLFEQGRILDLRVEACCARSYRLRIGRHCHSYQHQHRCSQHSEFSHYALHHLLKLGVKNYLSTETPTSWAVLKPAGSPRDCMAFFCARSAARIFARSHNPQRLSTFGEIYHPADSNATSSINDLAILTAALPSLRISSVSGTEVLYDTTGSEYRDDC